MRNGSPLTERQQRILIYVWQYSVNQYRPPTVREIMNGCGFVTTSIVVYHLERLEELGYLIREAAIARGLRLTPRGERAALIEWDASRQAATAVGP